MTWRLLLIVGALLGAAAHAHAAEAPAAVSPGDPSRLVRIGDTCPTFNWGAVEGAESYELVVYRIAAGGFDDEAVLTSIIPGSALGWTPSLDDCLEHGGRYGWSVRATGDDSVSEWSTPRLFRVVEAPSRAEFEAALQTVRRYLAAEGGGTAAPEGGPSGGGDDPSGEAAIRRPRAVEAGDVRMRIDGGVVATSFAGDGSALSSLDPANLASGTAEIDVTGTAANVTGTVGIGNGGTGATDAAGARAALGVAAGPHTVNTTCDGAACDGSGYSNVTAVAGDSATGFFSEGQIEAARIADEITRDDEINAVALCASLLPAHSRRYLDLGDGTVLDCRTKLLWLKDASCPELQGTDEQGRADFTAAGNAANVLADGACGLTDGSSAGDWTLPTAAQLCSSWSGSDLLPCPASAAAHSLIDSSLLNKDDPKVANTLGTGAWSEGDPFVGVQPAEYWSMTVEANLGWYADLSSGNVRGDATGLPEFYVWPVRSIPISAEVDAGDLTGVVLIEKGGTGATDTAVARFNLGVVAGPHTVDTTCNGATCDGASFSNVTAVKGDSATSFFDTGRIEEPRIAQALTRDTELLGSSPVGAQLLLCATRNRGGWRYWDLGDGTVLDCNTGTIWLKDAGCLGAGTWSASAAAGSVQEKVAILNGGADFGCQEYTPGAYLDWRLPALSDLCSAGTVEGACPAASAPESLIDVTVGIPKVVNSTGTGTWSPDDPFVDVGLAFPEALYWSATGESGTDAWYVFLNNGAVGTGPQTDLLRAWPVRGGR